MFLRQCRFLYHKLKTNSYKLKTSFGFTLTELLVVVGIIAILATIGGMASMSVIRRAQAARIVSDLKKIEGAWLEWRADSHHHFLHESEYTQAQECNGSLNNALISETDLFTDSSPFSDGTSNANWRGPYLTSPLRDPWGQEYTYDADGGTDYDPSAGTLAAAGYGINLVLRWCPDQNGQYGPLLPILDRAIDNSDGQYFGRFRWVYGGNNTNRFLYLLDPKRP